MNSVNLTARLAGPTLMAIGLGVLLNRTLYTDAIVEAVKSTTLIFLSGVACLLAGVAILNAYRAWTADWRVLVTIVGWLFVIAGVVRIVLPSFAAGMATTVYGGTMAMPIAGAVALVIGAILSFMGYRAEGR
jgi:hypothetical protein